MIRVLYIASGDYKYGASKSMMSLLLYLKDNYDIQPVLLTKKNNELNRICNEKGIENYSCWYADFMSGAPYTSGVMRFIKHVVKYGLYIYGNLTKKKVLKCGLDFNTIDIVHTNLNRIDIGAYISKKFNIPHVWHIREFGKEDYNVVFYRPNTIKYMNDNADYFIAISEAVEKCWVAKGIAPDKIVTVYNGLEKKGYIQRRGSQNPKQLKMVISGHVQNSKGQLQIVKAIAKLPSDIRDNVQLDIIGEGYKDYIKQINKVIKDNSLTNINLLGYCNNIPKKLAEYDVGVMCSKAEGFGRVTVEYMLAGLAVIASDTGANPEIIEKSGKGLLYHYNDIDSLAECIKEIYNNKSTYCEKELDENLFTVKEYSDNVYKVYKMVTGEK